MTDQVVVKGSNPANPETRKAASHVLTCHHPSPTPILHRERSTKTMKQGSEHWDASHGFSPMVSQGALSWGGMANTNYIIDYQEIDHITLYEPDTGYFGVG